MCTSPDFAYRIGDGSTALVSRVQPFRRDLRPPPRRFEAGIRPKRHRDEPAPAPREGADVRPGVVGLVLALDPEAEHVADQTKLRRRVGERPTPPLPVD